MHTVRRTAAWLALAGLAATFHAPPAAAGITSPPEPAGLNNLFRYCGCAISVAAASTPLGLAGAFLNCARTLLDEITRDA
jgi:hypothetical protein